MSTPYGPSSGARFDAPAPQSAVSAPREGEAPTAGVIAPELGTVGGSQLRSEAGTSASAKVASVRSRVSQAVTGVAGAVPDLGTVRRLVAQGGQQVARRVSSAAGSAGSATAGATGSAGDEAAPSQGRSQGRSGRRRRQREDVMVPEAEFSSYYGRNIVKPAPWKHEIPSYLYMGGLAAGSALVAVGGEFTGRRELQRNSRLVALAALTGSTGALIKDLGKPSRFLNMMRTVKLTSPMSVGSWILAGFGFFTGTAAVSEVMRFVVPKDVPGQQFWPVGDRLASIGAGMFSAPLAAYTAVLLSDTATPTWHASYKQLPFVFVGSALSAAGGAAMACTTPDECGPARRLAVGGTVLELAAFTIMERELGMLGEPLHQSKAGRYLKGAKIAAVAGSALTLVAGRTRVGAAGAGLALNAASALTRFGVFEAGMASARDPKYTVVPQRERLERRLEEVRLTGRISGPTRDEDLRVAHHTGTAVTPY